MMMLGKDRIFYGNADVVHRIGRDIHKLWRIEKDKDPTTVPFYHAWLPLYSWLSGSITSNMYQSDEHSMLIGSTSRWDKQVYLLPWHGTTQHNTAHGREADTNTSTAPPSRNGTLGLPWGAQGCTKGDRRGLATSRGCTYEWHRQNRKDGHRAPRRTG